MTTHTSKSKPEIEFQYGGRLSSETGSSFISAVDLDISVKFGGGLKMQDLKMGDQKDDRHENAPASALAYQ